MEVLIILGIGILLALVGLWKHEPWQPMHAWPDLKANNSKTLPSSWAVLRWLGQWPWYSNYGWWIKKISLNKLSQRLGQANIPLTEDEFWAFKQWLWTTGSLVSLLWLWFGILSLQIVFLFLLVWGLVMVLPDLFLLTVISRRQAQMSAEVPYFLDLLTLTLQGGGNLEKALQATTNNYQGALSEVVAKKLVELSWGRSLEDLFKELKEVVKDEDFQHFLGSLLRAKKLGVSLSETLAIQAELLRTRRRQQAEELSRTAAVKISIPLVLFVFPALLIIYIGPGILQLMERT